MVTQVVTGRLVRVIWVCVVIHVFSPGVWAGYGGGTGTPEDPYLIFTAEQLNAVGVQSGDWDKHFKLMADIDLGGFHEMEFNRIGTPEEGAFTGTFDGNYRTISNFRWSSEDARYVGLFGFVDGKQVRIANLAMVDCTVAVESGQYAGVLIGFIREGAVANCHVRRSTVSSQWSVGGLVGRADGTAIMDCTACARVRGMDSVGGLIGVSQSGEIRRCEAACDIAGQPGSSSSTVGGLAGTIWYNLVAQCHAACAVRGDYYVGGLIGVNYMASVCASSSDGTVSGRQDVGGLIGQNRGGTATNCYALAGVDGIEHVGGLVGFNGSSCSSCSASARGWIDRCYAAGLVVGESDVGGLVGLEDRSDTSRSVWDVQTTGCMESAGGVPRTTLGMHKLSEYLRERWDFVGEVENGMEEIWRMPASGGYPQLAWQVATGDFDADGDVDFHDYAVFAERWRGIDTGFWSRATWMAADGTIDFDDLMTLTQGWLAGRK